jgi:hypothetical protein
MSGILPLMRSDAPAPAGPAIPGHSWAGSLIAALLIALASALLPGSVPASQTVGSAFNPATTQVALNRDESEQAGRAALQKERQRPEVTGGGDETPLATARAETPRTVLPHPRLADRQPAGTPPARSAFTLSGAGPRAPPAAA